MSTDQSGFTIPELLIVIVTSSLFTALIMTFTIVYWQNGYRLEANLESLSTRLNLGDFLRNAIGTSSGLIIQNSIPDNNPTSPDPNQSPALYWKPTHAVPGNKSVGATGTTTPLIYYRQPSLNSSRAYIMNGTQPYEDEYILYMDGTTKSLKLRALANPAASGNRLKTSCPANLASSSCPADKILATDLSSIDMRYFSRTGNLIDYTSMFDTTTNSYTGPDFPVVEVVEFGVNLNKSLSNQKTDSQTMRTVIRIALRNA